MAASAPATAAVSLEGRRDRRRRSIRAESATTIRRLRRGAPAGSLAPRLDLSVGLFDFGVGDEDLLVGQRGSIFGSEAVLERHVRGDVTRWTSGFRHLSRLGDDLADEPINPLRVASRAPDCRWKSIADLLAKRNHRRKENQWTRIRRRQAGPRHPRARAPSCSRRAK